MKKSRFSEEQVIGILKQQEAGMKTADLCREHGISAATFYGWKQKFGGMDVSEAQRLKAQLAVQAWACGLAVEEYASRLVDESVAASPARIAEGRLAVQGMIDFARRDGAMLRDLSLMEMAHEGRKY